MNINICGIPHKVKEVEVLHEADEGITQGEIVYSQATIYIKKGLPKKLKKSVLYHEITHGILMQLGYNELASDEQFVQAFSNSLYRMFKLRESVSK